MRTCTPNNRPIEIGVPNPSMGPLRSAVAKDAAEDGVYVLEVMAEVEERVNLFGLQRLGDLRIGLQVFEKRRPDTALMHVVPDRHGVTLDEGVGRFSR